MAKKTAAPATIEEKMKAVLVPAEEQPYAVPENWCWTLLTCITSHIADGSHNPPPNTGVGVPLLSATNIHDRIIDFDAASRWVTNEQWIVENERTSIELGDVLLTIVATIGRVAVVTTSSKFALQRSVATIKPRIDSLYLSYYLETPFVQAFMNTNAKGTAQKGFYLNSLAHLHCAVAPLAEQRRIVDRIKIMFAQLDEAKEKAQAVIDGYEDRKAAILHRAFTGELTAQIRAKKSLDLSSWKKTNLGEIVSGFKYGSSEKSDYLNIGTPVFRIPNIGDGNIDFDDMKYLSGEADETYIVHENDVLIIRSNGSRDLVGKCAIVPRLEGRYAYASFLIKIIPSNAIRPDFLVRFLNSSDARSQMFAKAKSSSGIHNINSKELGSIILMLPEQWEQEQVVRIIDDLLAKEDAVKEAAETTLATIDIMKQSILSRAFRGELGTNNPNDEPAEELLKRILLDQL